MTNQSDPSNTEASSIYSCDPKTIHAYLVLAAEDHPEKIHSALARVIACTMMADTAFLLSMPDSEGQVVIHEGFDYQNEEVIHGGIAGSKSIPTLAENLNAAQPMRLILENDDLLQLPSLSKILSIPEPGGLLMVPLLTPAQEPVGGIMLLSPYSHKQWSFQDQIYLTAMVDTVASVLHRVDSMAELQANAATQAQPAEEPQPEAVEPSEPKEADPRQVFDKLTSSSGDESLVKNDLIVEDLVARQAEMETVIASLRDENDRLKKSALQTPAAPAGTEESPTQPGSELNLTLDALASEQNKSQDAYKRLDEYDRLAGEKKILLPPQVEQLSLSLHEMHSPVSAINGYVDLLFGESIGALTPVQKRFLERIKTAAQRIDKIMNEIISGPKTGELSSGSVAAPIGLRTVIDQALESCRTAVEEKSLVIDQDLPESGLLIHNQPDLIQKLMNSAILTAVNGAAPNDHLHLKLVSIPGDKQSQMLISIVTASGEVEELDYNAVLKEIPETPVLDDQNPQAEEISQLAGDVIQIGGRFLVRGTEKPEIFIVIPQIHHER
jgi:signal transduction histidine kinase